MIKYLFILMLVSGSAVAQVTTKTDTPYTLAGLKLETGKGGYAHPNPFGVNHYNQSNYDTIPAMLLCSWADRKGRMFWMWGFAVIYKGFVLAIGGAEPPEHTYLNRYKKPVTGNLIVWMYKKRRYE